jgi:hypothetical protein
MAGADSTQAAQEPQPRKAGPLLGRILGALVVIAATASVLFVLVVFMSFASWKLGVAVVVIAVGGAAFAWNRSLFAPWLRYVLIVTIVLTAVSTTLLLRTTWMAQADHDARLSTMVAELCEVQLPAGSAFDDCDGSISNTGNGNSCRYLASAVVNTDDRATVVASLRDQGFAETRLNVFREVMDDGRTYLLERDSLRVFLQSSWQNDEGDLRCT